MKKDGFTLIEIIVSITLVSVVLVSMLVTLVNLREVYTDSNDDTDIRIYGSSLSRAINKDLKDNKGIKTATCIVDSCRFELVNGETRTLNLSLDSTEFDITPTQTIASGTKAINRTTLAYSNSSTTPESLITIKTITSITTDIRFKNVVNGNTVYTTEKNTVFYHFTGISYEKFEYTNKVNTAKKDKIHKITVHASDSNYDVIIYSFITE